MNMTPIIMRDKTKLMARDWGLNEPSATSLVILMHGLGGHSGYYDVFSAFLQDYGVAILSYDRRGHGRSEGKRGDIESIEKDIEDLEDVISWSMRKSRDKKIFLLADSWGCLLSLLYFYKRRPTTIAGLILMSPPVKLNIRLEWLPGIIRTVITLLGAFLTLNFNPMIEAMFPLKLASRNVRFLQMLNEDKYTNMKMSLHYGLLTASLLRNAVAYGKSISVPTLLFQGGHDMILREKGGEILFDAISSIDKQRIVFKNAYHTLCLDPDTQQVCYKIADWIRGH
jgi:alpha-beta hydrolase superfamily lysophospholipase